MKTILEVCCGSVQDCIISQEIKADRIELNSALALGGLTPTVASLKMAKNYTDIPILCMVRSRPGGFHYDDLEFRVMFEEAKDLLEAGADGLVFGFLNADASVQKAYTEVFVDLCHEAGKEAIFHRAFDRVKDPITACETLIEIGVDRILTSGLETSAVLGIPLLRQLQEQFGDDIEFCMGAGINEENIQELISKTGITQAHGSFKKWYNDPTTSSEGVSYRYSEQGDYDGVDPEILKKVQAILAKL